MLIAIGVDQSARENKIIAVKGVNRVFKVVPPLADDVAGAVGERDQGKLAAGLFAPQFFAFDQKGGADGLVGCELTDEDFLHVVSRQ